MMPGADSRLERVGALPLQIYCHVDPRSYKPSDIARILAALQLGERRKPGNVYQERQPL